MKNTSVLSCQESNGSSPLSIASNAVDTRSMISNQISFVAHQIDSVAQSLDPAFRPENQNTPPDQFIGSLRHVLSGLGNLFNSLAESPALKLSFRDLEMQECSSLSDISERHADESFGGQDSMDKGTAPLMGFRYKEASTTAIVHTPIEGCNVDEPGSAISTDKSQHNPLGRDNNDASISSNVNINILQTIEHCHKTAAIPSLEADLGLELSIPVSDEGHILAEHGNPLILTC